jgi:hypothetical protein
MKKKEWKARAKAAEADAESERKERLHLQRLLFRLRCAVSDRVPDVGITFAGWVDHAVRLIEDGAGAPGSEVTT